MRHVIALALVGLSFNAIACSSAPDASEPAGASEEDLSQTIEITQADDGKTIELINDKAFHISLDGNATTGYEWSVVSVDAKLGDPYKQNYKADSSGAVGSVARSGGDCSAARSGPGDV